jgi:hypothetical protein
MGQPVKCGVCCGFGELEKTRFAISPTSRLEFVFSQSYLLAVIKLQEIE